MASKVAVATVQDQKQAEQPAVFKQEVRFTFDGAKIDWGKNGEPIITMTVERVEVDWMPTAENLQKMGLSPLEAESLVEEMATKADRMMLAKLLASKIKYE